MDDKIRTQQIIPQDRVVRPKDRTMSCHSSQMTDKTKTKSHQYTVHGKIYSIIGEENIELRKRGGEKKKKNVRDVSFLV